MTTDVTTPEAGPTSEPTLFEEPEPEEILETSSDERYFTLSPPVVTRKKLRSPRQVLVDVRRWLAEDSISYLKSGRWIVPLICWLALGKLLWFFVGITLADPGMVPDSWYYYDLSKSVWTNPGYTHTFRSFYSPEAYTPAFPLMYPAMIAIVDLVFKQSYASNVLTNMFCLVGAAAVLSAAFRRFFGYRSLGPVLILMLMINGFFLQEFTAGGSGPAAVLCFAVVVYTLTRQPFDNWSLFIVGLASGLMVLCRFDALLPSLLLPGFLWLVRLGTVRQLLRTYLGVLVGIGPWVLYSLVHFRSFFVSDTGFTATAVPKFANVIYYLPEKVPTVRDDPSGWWHRVQPEIAPYFENAGEVITFSFWPRVLMAGAVLAVLLAIVVPRVRKRQSDVDPADRPSVIRTIVNHRAVRALLALTLAWWTGSVLTSIPAGSYLHRYFTNAALALILLLVCVLLAIPHRTWFRNTVVVLISVWSAVIIPNALLNGSPLMPNVILQNLSGTKIERVGDKVAACMQKGDRVMVRGMGTIVNVLGPMTGKTAIYEPMNLSSLRTEQIRQFIHDYKVTLLYLDPRMPPARMTAIADQWAEDLGYPGATLTPYCTPGLFVVPPPKNE